MRENARKLGEIRKLCNKVAVIRNMGQQPPGVDVLHLSSNDRSTNHPNHLEKAKSLTSLLGGAKLKAKKAQTCHRRPS